MKHLVFLIVVLFVTASLNAANDMNLNTCVTGFVTDHETGEPIEGVRIRNFTTPNGWEEFVWHEETLTDENGYYELDIVAEPGWDSALANNYSMSSFREVYWDANLVFEKEGLYNSTDYLRGLKAFEPCREFDLRLYQDKGPSGQVVDSEGNPLQDVVIESTDFFTGFPLSGIEPPRPVYQSVASTDDEGRFITDGMPLFSFTKLVRIQKAGFATEYAYLLDDSENLITLNPSAAPLSVHILDHQNKPIPGVSVFVGIQDIASGMGDDLVTTRKTDQEGVAFFDNLGGQTYDIWTFFTPRKLESFDEPLDPEKPDGSYRLIWEIASDSAHTSVTLSNENPISLTINLPEFSLVSGRVLDKENKGIEGLKIRGSIYPSLVSSTESVDVTDEDGFYEVREYVDTERFSHGGLMLELPESHLADWYYSEDIIYLPSSDKKIENLDIVLEKANILELNLTNEPDRKRIIKVLVESGNNVELWEGHAPFQSGPSRNAWFVFSDQTTVQVPPEHEIFVTCFTDDGYILEKLVSGEHGSLLEQDLKFRSVGSIKATFTLDGKPTDLASVYFYTEDHHNRQIFDDPYDNHRNIEGTWLNDRVIPGKHQMRLSFSDSRKIHGEYSITQIEVLPDEICEIDFDFQTHQIIKGKITRDGDPVRYADVSVYNEKSLVRDRLPINEKGEFEFRVLDNFTDINANQIEQIRIELSITEKITINAPFDEFLDVRF